MKRCYVIKSPRRDQYYTGISGRWSGFFRDAARWSTLRATSLVVNSMLEAAFVVALVPVATPSGCAATATNAGSKAER